MHLRQFVSPHEGAGLGLRQADKCGRLTAMKSTSSTGT
jgi:hypothetical protein